MKKLSDAKRSVLGNMIIRQAMGGLRKEDRLHITNSNLLTGEQIDLLSIIAAKPFCFGGFESLTSIIDEGSVRVKVQKGVYTCSVPLELENLKNYWATVISEQKLANDDCTTMIDEAIRRSNEIDQEIEAWKSMLKLGEYLPEDNSIVLYPEAMENCIAAKGWEMDHFNLLLVTTFVHEIMHAYFDRKGHETYPYIPFVEEPLAEFGMLLFLKETGHEFYEQAYNNVKVKTTCYKYGASLMDRHIYECNLLNGSYESTIRQFLESYKVYIAERPKYPTEKVDGRDIVDITARGSENAQKRIVIPNWQNVVDYPPRYFYDDVTKTLGLDGVWTNDIMWSNPVIDFIAHLHIDSERIANVYLGEHFDCVNKRVVKLIASLRNVIVSPANTTFKM